jgi:hypothetical protein
MKNAVIILSVWGALHAIAGSLVLIDKQPTGSSGTVDVKCNVTKKVSLSIADVGQNDLVSNAGIDFGNVDADGTTGKVPGTIVGNHAQYVADFMLSATRTGTGKVTLTAKRSVKGNFNDTDGILIEDNGGLLQALNGSGSSVTVMDSQDEGDFNKKLGINVYSEDNGVLTSTVQFTLSAL